jgi:hypothetical protein
LLPESPFDRLRMTRRRRRFTLRQAQGDIGAQSDWCGTATRAILRQERRTCQR